MSEEEHEQIDNSTLAMSRTRILQALRRKRQAFLDILDLDGQVEKSHPLPTTMELVIGRTQDNFITLNDNNVSRHHSRIYSQGEDFFIEDLGSTNGTYINAVQVAKCSLRSNDLIQIGDTKMIYYEREEIEADDKIQIQSLNDEQ